MGLLERFLRYVRIATFSDSNSLESPSTNSQRILANMLIQELESLGISVYFDMEHCYVYGCLKGNIEAPKIGFIAHMDTSEDAKGIISPKITYNYDGQDVVLSENIILKTQDNPDLLTHIGETLITSDGTSLLGADDKAGIAEIMEMLEYFCHNDERHGDIFVCFTPDEEIGSSTKYFDMAHFPAQFAYTVDGLDLGEISYENFNAATVFIKIKGVVTHLGSAKDKLVNALSVANKINALLPNEVPENTEGNEGYYHLHKLNGDFANVTMQYLIRDFDKANLERRKEKFRLIIERLKQEYGDIFELDIVDSYFNMKDVISEHFHLIEYASKTMESLNIKPISNLVRGGTDGARLSYKGLPCPNLGTGSHNVHAVYEYITLEDMEKVREILIGIVKSYARDNDLIKKIRELK